MDGYNKMKLNNAHLVDFLVAGVLKSFHELPDAEKPFRFAATLKKEKRSMTHLSLTDRQAHFVSLKMQLIDLHKSKSSYLSINFDRVRKFFQKRKRPTLRLIITG